MRLPLVEGEMASTVLSASQIVAEDRRLAVSD